jgi:hypothetical protein
LIATLIVGRRMQTEIIRYHLLFSFFARRSA